MRSHFSIKETYYIGCKTNTIKLSVWYESESGVQLFVTPWTGEFSRPEYCSGQPFPSPADLPNPGIKPRSPALPVDSLPAEPQGKLKNTGMGSPSLPQQTV